MIFVKHNFRNQKTIRMKITCTLLSLLLSATMLFAQNPKVAVFDVNNSDIKFLKNDVRYSYYYGIISYDGLDAIDVDEIYPVLEERNYNSDMDTNYSEASEIASDFGADYILIPKLEGFKSSTYVFSAFLIDTKTRKIIAKGKAYDTYKVFAYENAFSKMISEYSAISTTPSYDKDNPFQNFSETINGINFEMIYVEGGTFIMGSDDQYASNYEKPAHNVTVDSYYMGKTEVTFELYDAFCEETGNARIYDEGTGRGKKPVINVSKQDALKFCDWLSKKTGMNYRLPTEAEWEYAAGGGNLAPSTPNIYAGGNRLYDYAWYDVSCISTNGGAQPVGLKKPNELGIHDMSGNVMELCSDWFSKNYYRKSPTNNPQGPKRGKSYSVRGGSYYDCQNDCQITRRKHGGASRHSCASHLVGFRLVCDIEK